VSELKIDPRLVRMAKLLTYRNGNVLTNGTGFFYMKDQYLFLITCRHVVHDEPSGHRPDQVEALIHTDKTDLTANGTLRLDLYEPDGVTPRYLTHPQLGEAADVVAVPVMDADVVNRYWVDAFTPDDLLPEDRTLPLGQAVLVIGFPLGFNDEKHNLPMVRSATIASVYPLPFKGDRYFVTDARLHRGASGSPVIAKLPRAGEEQPSWFLLGVHAASLDVSNRDPEQDERLGLNVAWYASVLDEVVRTPEERDETP